jgi:hypothetical protein
LDTSVDAPNIGLPFPRRLLAWPPVAPLFLIAVLSLAEVMGHRWNVHGDLVLMLMLVISSCAVALLLEVIAVSMAVARLTSNRASWTAANLLFTLCGIAYIGACSIFISRL